MHSSGRGEESPDAYRGVVLPSGRDQAPLTYGEHVQPAGGTPWGAPPQAQPGGGPESADATQMLPPTPADATQMLPPYPAGAPGAAVPGPGTLPPPGPSVADATQMLPPYPGAQPPARRQQGGHQGPESPQQAAVPPMPPAPPQQQFRPQDHQPPYDARPAAAQEPPPVEATQAMPLSAFQEQGPQDPSYGAQAAQQQPGYAQGGDYGQQPTYEQAYGSQQQPPQQQPPYGGGQAYAGQERGYGDAYGADGYGEAPPPPSQPDSDYEHLFRNDVPSPPPVRPHIIQPPDRQQAPQAQQPPVPPYGGQPGAYEPSYGYGDGGDGGSGRRKLSPKVLIGIVVAGCVVAGLVVGGLLNSGGDSGAGTTGATAPPSAGASTSAAAASAGASADPGRQQAQALDALLQTSGASRSQVVNAVASIKGCSDLDTAAGDLRSAQAQRTGLVTQLGSLSVDQLPDHDALTTALTRAWQASAAADGHYANWADQARNDKKVCKGGHARATGEAQAGNQQSGTATEQKKHAVRLWNTIAQKYGLPTRTFSQL